MVFLLLFSHPASNPEEANFLPHCLTHETKITIPSHSLTSFAQCFWAAGWIFFISNNRTKEV
jgi:hypothetical protein